MDVARWLDAQGPDYPEAHVALVDALRDYIRATAHMMEDAVLEGSISKEQAEAVNPYIERCKQLLSVIENSDFDLSLCGMRKPS